MYYREIKQYHIAAIISVFTLLLVDILAFFVSYAIAINSIDYSSDFKYPERIMVLIIVISYIFKRYNPSPVISRGVESKLLVQLYYLLGIGYMVYKILTGSIRIDQAQFELIFIHVFIIMDIICRLCIRTGQRYFLKKGIGARSTIIIGKGQDAYHIADEINRNPSFGFILKGYFEEYPSSNMNRYCDYLGKSKDIESYIKENNIREIIIALEDHEHENLLKIISRFNLFNVCIKIIPDMYEAITGQVRIDTINGLPLLDINPDIMTEFQEVFKRMGDLVIACVGLVIMLPINLLIAIFINLDTPGKIFYKQVRIGLNGRPFTLMKFRTMYTGSEDETGPIWSHMQDSRITRAGKILRKYHLDEIPQLLNVVYGHMSIIGPRPERPDIINQLIKKVPYYSHRLKVKPGLTGWAQIKGNYDSSIDDVKVKLKNDFYYIENISIILDLEILIKTVIIVLKGKGR